jgi:ACT domain-containing protein
MRTLERIARNNVDLLSKRDVLALMDEIIEACDGNVSKACKLVGIQRKTYYNWKEHAKSIKSKWLIKPKSKEKVLTTALMLNPIDTLDKLTLKTFNRTCDLLYFTLSMIYGEILDSEDVKEKEKLIDEFVKLIKKYDISPVERLSVEINDMLADIKNECPWYNFEQKLKAFKQPFDLNYTVIIKPIEDEEVKSFNYLTEQSLMMEKQPKETSKETPWGLTNA